MATFLGFLPQSIIFSWFGAEATSWFWVIMMRGSILTGVLAVTTIVVQWIRRRMRRPAPAPSLSPVRMGATRASTQPTRRWNTPSSPKAVPVTAGSYARSPVTWQKDVRSDS